MVLGVCYHSNGNIMSKNFKLNSLPELIELLSEIKGSNEIKSDKPPIEKSK